MTYALDVTGKMILYSEKTLLTGVVLMIYVLTIIKLHGIKNAKRLERKTSNMWQRQYKSKRINRNALSI